MLVLNRPLTTFHGRAAARNARQKSIAFAVTPGQAIYQKFVVTDPNDASKKRISDSSLVWWQRDKQMENYTAELIRAHEGSLELEELYSNRNLVVGDVSTNGAVKHLGAGVFLEKDTPAIDTDSICGNPMTITRPDLRDVAHRVVNALDQTSNAVVVGHPGTGKTRGGLTYALQILLSRGEAVLRVGYKDNTVYAFLPNKSGKYEVWRSKANSWDFTLLTCERTAYALIDPPEGASYASNAACKVAEFVANDDEKHCRNFYEDGILIIADMPTEDEMVAMTEVLWDDERSPIGRRGGGGQTFSDLAARQEEVRHRCALVGCEPRAVFSANKFQNLLRFIIRESQNIAIRKRFDMLLDLYNIDMFMTNSDLESSVRSRLYNLKPFSSTKPEIPVIEAKPLVKYYWRKLGKREIMSKIFRTALILEDFCALLLQGGTVDGVNFPPRSPLRASNAIETKHFILKTSSQSGSVVVASENYPVLDFATSIYDWYDAKSGKSKPEVKAGAFATLMLHLGLADKVGDRLVMKPQYENDTFSLTMLRNGGPGAEKSHYKWISGRGRHKDLNGDELKKFFEEHVEVKVLDTTKWEDRASDTSDNIIEECLEKYGYSDMDAYIQRARWNLLNWISRMER